MSVNLFQHDWVESTYLPSSCQNIQLSMSQVKIKLIQVKINLLTWVDTQFPFSPSCNLGEQGWRSGKSTSTPSIDAICGLNLLLVLSLAPRGFSPGIPVFPSPQKPTFPNSNSTRNQVDEEPLCGCAICKSLFNIYFYIFLFIIHKLGLGDKENWESTHR